MNITERPTDVTMGPERIAFTVDRRLGVLDLSDGDVTWRDGWRPAWSRDGRLAWIVPSGVAIDGVVTDIPGAVEYIEWSPDGSALLAGVAEPGAEVADAFGSGLVPGRAEGWEPAVSSREPVTGRRSLWTVRSGTASRVPGLAANVWQAAWAGNDRIVCVMSDEPGESAWYDARLGVVSSDGLTYLPTPPGQLGIPASNGERISVIAGAMSDRGLYTGGLWVDGSLVDTAGVDVTDQAWVDGERIVFAGLRGLTTVIGVLDTGTKEVQTLWASAETCGDFFPAVSVSGGRVAAVVHSYTRPPTIALIEDGSVVPVLSFGGAPSAGSIRPVRWSAPDGVTIEGLLVEPSGPGPYPLIVHVHGGPVWAWRNEWSMHYPYTPLLAERGFAVLHVNMRGSSGRGQEFVLAGLRDMGGRDALDFISGIDALVAEGVVDRTRVGITGNSYGGFMATWLVATSDRFAAAVARSPVTDWVSQHHTSNLPGFDRVCLSGGPLDPASDYRTRSPLYLADAVRTPIMLMAGAKDLATPPEQAAMFHRALIERGRTSTLVIYPEEGHGVRHRPALIDQCVRMLDFFAHHMAR